MHTNKYVSLPSLHTLAVWRHGLDVEEEGVQRREEGLGAVGLIADTAQITVRTLTCIFHFFTNAQ